METHAHHLHKAPGKNFWHYFFEFFMLFLAVSLGFFVENLRERHVENERATELAKSFYAELKADSVIIQRVFQNRAMKDSAFTYVKNYYRDSSIVNCSKQFSINFLYAYVTHGLTLFDPNDAVLQQLIHSGSLRYFKSQELQTLADKLSIQITKVRFRNEIEWNYTNDYLLPFLMKHADQQWFDELGKRDTSLLVALHKYENSSDVIPFQLSKLKEFDTTDAINRTGIYQIMSKSTWQNAYTSYFKLNMQLLESLRKEYHLE